MADDPDGPTEADGERAAAALRDQIEQARRSLREFAAKLFRHKTPDDDASDGDTRRKP